MNKLSNGRKMVEGLDFLFLIFSKKDKRVGKGKINFGDSDKVTTFEFLVIGKKHK